MQFVVDQVLYRECILTVLNSNLFFVASNKIYKGRQDFEIPKDRSCVITIIIVPLTSNSAFM